MRMVKSFFVLAILMSSFIPGTFAQVKVETTGKVKLGNERSGNDYNNEVTQEILGLGTDTYRTGSKLSFGDYGSGALGGANVYIGEYGTGDSDKLELGGKNGFHFMVSGDKVTPGMTFNWIGSSWALDVSGLVRSQGVTLSSDIRLKSNVIKLDNGLSLVKQLQAIKYDYQRPIDPNRVKLLQEAKPSTEKEQKSIEEARKRLDEESKPQKEQIGFSAQEVQKVLPQLVSTDNQGFLSVNYTAMIPILVEAIKEQQILIEALQKEVEALKKK